MDGALGSDLSRSPVARHPPRANLAFARAGPDLDDLRAVPARDLPGELSPLGAPATLRSRVDQWRENCRARFGVAAESDVALSRHTAGPTPVRQQVVYVAVADAPCLVLLQSRAQQDRCPQHHRDRKS